MKNLRKLSNCSKNDWVYDMTKEKEERFYDLWNKNGNHVGKVKCSKSVLKQIVGNVPGVVDSSVADVDSVTVEIEDHYGNTIMHFEVNENQEVEKVEGGDIADITTDYLRQKNDKLFRVQENRN